jgi:Myosin heavy chain
VNLLTLKITWLGVNFSENFGLGQLDYYHYLSYGGNHKVEGTNDAHDFQETLKGKKQMAAHT